MKTTLKFTFALLFLLLITPLSTSAGEMSDDPVLAMLVIDQLELRNAAGENSLVWGTEGWVGKDIDKLWFKAEGEYGEGQVEDAELQLLYSRAVSSFWDLQLGWRKDLRPNPQRDWLAVGIKGLAPYHFAVDGAVFVGEGGSTAARLRGEYEVVLTQRLVLVPDIELNLYGKNDPDTGTGSGFSDLEAGLRLRYELRRELAPYVGVSWSRLYGTTEDSAREAGSVVEKTQLITGVRVWF